ncbi:hypothetical protein LK07_01585 [Streptomyces pluripotens]|uniref:YokE-like PH domain-containing protein n=1 Tax=Streptomyces pluripotens TaxID=1355015 RepID=A0A221NSI7_9ACTN|nr:MULTISPECIES: hypothetical protein [Streptomyces]ARP68672.1 hypothetical protein LK06_000510 [Streptomyces pluripotens]ASN22930.1 hypothetical protein LK07_01585 [Streptomyces pluripotens]KIE26700.1 hypothetical protein LK08_12275 [Streptomyces sp. MUSC 125]MCH0559232.1 hypothetical protein [Streptomyces sp. MUM 16J]
MNNRRRQQLLQSVAPLLTEGEQVEFTSLAKVGSVSVKRRVLTSALVGVLSAGTVIATVQPRPMYLALTDRQLLFFDAKTTTGRPGELLLAMPRELTSAAPMQKALLGLGLQTVLTVQGQEKGLKLTFPPAGKAAGRDLVSRLAVTA